jgi:serine/threonine protein kinase
VHEVALGVARGMEYLHNFRGRRNDGTEFTKPLMHRDLKSPNLLLQEDPQTAAAAGRPLLAKVADFGLSRDKDLREVSEALLETNLMTGCGSILWMAPEILLGKTYNEKVDVFAYAMCLVELVDQVCALSSYADRHHEQMGD